MTDQQITDTSNISQSVIEYAFNLGRYAEKVEQLSRDTEALLNDDPEREVIETDEQLIEYCKSEGWTRPLEMLER